MTDDDWLGDIFLCIFFFPFGIYRKNAFKITHFPHSLNFFFLHKFFPWELKSELKTNKLTTWERFRHGKKMFFVYIFCLGKENIVADESIIVFVEVGKHFFFCFFFYWIYAFDLNSIGRSLFCRLKNGKIMIVV